MKFLRAYWKDNVARLVNSLKNVTNTELIKEANLDLKKKFMNFI